MVCPVILLPVQCRALSSCLVALFSVSVLIPLDYWCLHSGMSCCNLLPPHTECLPYWSLSISIFCALVHRCIPSPFIVPYVQLTHLHFCITKTFFLSFLKGLSLSLGDLYSDTFLSCFWLGAWFVVGILCFLTHTALCPCLSPPSSLPLPLPPPHSSTWQYLTG